jgi:predicted membrane-bound spermidine synthase
MANAAHTTFVVDLGQDNLKLYFDSHSMSGTSPGSQTYMRLMAHVPLLAQPEPRSALLICFGVGNTASAIASHSGIRQIDVVDLNRNVFLTAPVFADFSRNVHLDRRLRLINDDGRGYLRKTSEVYDLITSEPPPPMAAGVYRLYSQEYYESALSHLSPDGMMSQWLPIYQLPQEAADMIIRTFVRVFPHALLFSGAGEELILVGSRKPVVMEEAIRRMRDDPAVTRDLEYIGITRANDLRLRVIAEDQELRRFLGSGRVLHDQHNDLEHLILGPENRATYRSPGAPRPTQG